MIEYVVCFAFTEMDKVILIRKNRPQWQAGRLNGVGGHMEPGETPLAAAEREFQEETGMQVTNWNLFCTMEGEAWRVYCFKAANVKGTPVALTDEMIELYDWDHLPGDVLPNLRWLVPMAHCDEVVSTVTYG